MNAYLYIHVYISITDTILVINFIDKIYLNHQQLYYNLSNFFKKFL